MTFEDEMLAAYAQGIFPMADTRQGQDFYWVEPKHRCQLPILNLHIPRRLRRTVLSFPYDVRINTDFPSVIDACATARQETWINQSIRDAFCTLHKKGYAHSVEVYKDDILAGGLYGLAIGSTFCGESMFSYVRDASKIALVHLCSRLWHAGFKILDAQFVNNHLLQFGAFEVTQNQYVTAMQKGISDPCNFMNTQHDEKLLLAAYFQARDVV